MLRQKQRRIKEHTSKKIKKRLNTEKLKEQGVIFCECGNRINETYRDKCEDCWAIEQARWSGFDQSVKLYL